MTNTEGMLKVQINATIPGIFGAYSSMGLLIGIDVPADTSGLVTKDLLESALKPYQDSAVSLLASSLNRVAIQAGKDKPFPTVD